MLACEGKASSEAEILSWGEVFGWERRFFGGFGSGRIGAVVADDDGGGGEGLLGERIEKTEEKVGTEAGGDEGDDGWGNDHENKLADERAGGEKGVRQKKRGLLRRKREVNLVMSLAEVLHAVKEMTASHRLQVAGELMVLRMVEDPSYQRLVSERLDEMRQGAVLPKEEILRLHEKLA
jgi:hypothetical protein